MKNWLPLDSRFGLTCVGLARRGERTPHVLELDLGGDGVPGAAEAVVLRIGVLRVRVAALDHEAGDHAMERGAVVEPLLHQLLEVGAGLGRGLLVELDHDPALRGLEHHGHRLGGGGRLGDIAGRGVRERSGEGEGERGGEDAGRHRVIPPWDGRDRGARVRAGAPGSALAPGGRHGSATGTDPAAEHSGGAGERQAVSNVGSGRGGCYNRRPPAPADRAPGGVIFRR